MFAAALLGAEAYIILANADFIFDDVPLRPNQAVRGAVPYDYDEDNEERDDVDIGEEDPEHVFDYPVPYHVKTGPVGGQLGGLQPWPSLLASLFWRLPVGP